MSSWPYVTFFLFSLQLIWLKFDFSTGYFGASDGTTSRSSEVYHFLELVGQHGRRAEWYNVTTNDGYILSLFRLIPTADRNVSDERPVVYLQHPLLSTADIFVVFGPKRSIPYALLDAGYDVWLGNFRGNSYSRRHKTLSPATEEFWNFTMDHYSLIDLPAMLDFVVNHTKKDKISYIGHSLGTTVGMMLLSARPEYNDKLNSLVLLGPVAYWKTSNSNRVFISVIARVTKNFWSSHGRVEFLPQGKVIYHIITKICGLHSLLLDLCYMPFNKLVGENRKQFKATETPEFFLHFPAGVSAQVFYHYDQHINTGEFRRYDYGSNESNYHYYGQHEPPEYNLTNIAVPTALLRAPNDPLSTDQDIDELTKRLRSNVVAYHELIEGDDEFSHADFVIAEDVGKFVFPRVLEILQQLNLCH